MSRNFNRFIKRRALTILIPSQPRRASMTSHRVRPRRRRTARHNTRTRHLTQRLPRNIRPRGSLTRKLHHHTFRMYLIPSRMSSSSHPRRPMRHARTNNHHSTNAAFRNNHLNQQTYRRRPSTIRGNSKRSISSMNSRPRRPINMLPHLLTRPDERNTTKEK